jgi:hypothetical protein
MSKIVLVISLKCVFCVVGTGFSNPVVKNVIGQGVTQSKSDRLAGCLPLTETMKLRLRCTQKPHKFTATGH